MTITVRSSDPTDVQTPVAEENKSAPENKKSQEQNESSESETEETDEVEAQDESEENSDSSDDSESDKPRKKSGFKRKIDKLISQREAAKQELEYWKSQAMKEKIAIEPAKEFKVETKANDQDEPDPDNFETHKEYVKAVTKWTLEQDKKASRQEEEKSKLLSEHEKLVKSHFERVKSFSEKNEDFNDVIESLGDARVSAALEDLILSSENGPEIIYELAKNPEEFKRLNSLNPLAAAREIGRIESRFASNTSEKKEPKKISNAPNPLEPVGKSSSASISKSIADPNLSQAEYERLRAEQIKRKRAS